eukprot:106454-Amphidinium_carterae.1
MKRNSAFTVAVVKTPPHEGQEIGLESGRVLNHDKTSAVVNSSGSTWEINQSVQMLLTGNADNRIDGLSEEREW